MTNYQGKRQELSQSLQLRQQLSRAQYFCYDIWYPWQSLGATTFIISSQSSSLRAFLFLPPKTDLGTSQDFDPYKDHKYQHHGFDVSTELVHAVLLPGYVPTSAC